MAVACASTTCKAQSQSSQYPRSKTSSSGWFRQCGTPFGALGRKSAHGSAGDASSTIVGEEQWYAQQIEVDCSYRLILEVGWYVMVNPIGNTPVQANRTIFTYVFSELNEHLRWRQDPHRLVTIYHWGWLCLLTSYLIPHLLCIIATCKIKHGITWHWHDTTFSSRSRHTTGRFGPANQ